VFGGGLASGSSRLAPLWLAFERWLTRPAARWAVPLIGVVLCATAVGRHYALDDYVLFLLARGDPRITGLAQGSFDLFTFTTGRPPDNLALIEHGVMLPWFTDPELRVAFFRPLSSLTHRLDLALWPGTPQLMYLHSLAWLGALLGLVALLYRRLETTAVVAGLASLLYAVDHVHGPAVAWLSNRNALVATFFGVLTLVVHDAARRGASRTAHVLGPVCLSVGLLSGEFAIGAGAYLVAYALFLETKGWRSGLFSLWPYLVVIGIWQIVYKTHDFGVHGSGVYVDPVGDPGRFLAALPTRLAVLMAAELGFLPSDALTLGPPKTVPLLVALAALTLAAAALVLVSFLRSDRVARFWALGMAAAAVPVAASFPSDRVLFFVGLGGMALVARVITAIFDPRAPYAGSLVRTSVAAGLSLIHLALSPALLPARAAQMQLLGRTLETASAVLDRVPDLETKSVVIVNAPLEIFATYIQAERAFEYRTRPPHLHPLSSAATELQVTRTGSSELTLKREQGFLLTPLERHYRSAVASLSVGSRVELSQMTAEVVSTTDDGRPAEVRFRFREPLESARLSFLCWKGDRYVPFDLPALGSTVTLPAEDIGRILMHSAFASP
jgi:hypothetical protein